MMCGHIVHVWPGTVHAVVIVITVMVMVMVVVMVVVMAVDTVCRT